MGNTKKKLQEKRQNTLKKGANSAKKDSGKKQVLGRGLSALMAASKVKVEFKPKSLAAVPSPEALQKSISREQALARPHQNNDNGLQYLNIGSVSANPDQPRKDFSQQELQELSDSIKKSGLLQPILVRRKQQDGQFEIVAGERRFRAAKLAGISNIPALIRDLDERETLELSIVENVQRSDLNPIEEALAYQRLANEFSVSQEDIAKAVGKSRSAIANSIRLLKLDTRIQELLKTGKLSAGHARAILMTESPEKAWELAQQILSNSLSVRETEKSATRPKSAFKKLDAASSAIENRLRRALGTKVVLISKKKGVGEIRLSYYSEEELQAIVEKIDR